MIQHTLNEIVFVSIQVRVAGHVESHLMKYFCYQVNMGTLDAQRAKITVLVCKVFAECLLLLSCRVHKSVCVGLGKNS